MFQRSNVWLVGAVLFLVVNLGGAGYAAALGELLHAGIHAGLLLPGAYLVWRLAPRRDALGIWRRGGSANPALSGDLSDRLTQLEQSIDAVAIEVERIGEGQRFMTRLFTEKGTPRAAGESAAEPNRGAAGGVDPGTSDAQGRVDTGRVESAKPKKRSIRQLPSP